MNFDEISKWLRTGVSLVLIPFGIYVVTSLESQSKQIALIEQKMDLRTAIREKQLSDISILLQDHEVRIRTLEHLKLGQAN